MKPFLSVIVPTHNDSQTLPLTLVDIDKKLSEADYSYEILVINDGSENKTSDMVARLSRIIRNLKLVDVGGWHGKGWMVKKGMFAARGNYRLFVNAGNISILDRFEEILSLFKDGFQIVTDADIPNFGCFTEEAALKIFGIMRINGRGFMKETLALARLFGFRAKKMKIGTSARFAEGIHPSVLWDTIRIRYWLKRGAYTTLEKPVL